MQTNQETGVTLLENQAVVTDRSVLNDIVRRRKRQWFALAPVLFALFLFCGLFLVPQTYTATVSMSMEQSTNTPSSFAALAGLAGAGNKKYTGVLRSRLFADEVEGMTDLHTVLGVRRNQAIEQIMKGIKVDDNALDGLMYVTVTLPAPPRLAPDPEGRRAKLKQTIAQVANGYVVAMRRWLKDSDTDKDLALIREANTQIARVQQAYDTSRKQLTDFVAGLGSAAPVSSDSKAGSGLKAGPETQMVVTAMGDLYKDREDLLEKIKANEADRAGTKHMVGGSLEQLRSIPEEDPILTSARAQYDSAVESWENTKVRYGDENPYVVAAAARMKLAEKHLREQAANILKGNTSEDVKHEAYMAELAMLDQHIQQAQGSLQSSRVLATRLKMLEDEADSAGKVWEEAEGRYAQVRLQTVSAANRMTPVDLALPPQSSKPGLLLTIVASLVGAAAIVVLWFLIEYLLRSQTRIRLIEAT